MILVSSEAFFKEPTLHYLQCSTVLRLCSNCFGPKYKEEENSKVSVLLLRLGLLITFLTWVN
jgi:hypothetical protein